MLAAGMQIARTADCVPGQFTLKCSRWPSPDIMESCCASRCTGRLCDSLMHSPSANACGGLMRWLDGASTAETWHTGRAHVGERISGQRRPERHVWIFQRRDGRLQAISTLHGHSAWQDSDRCAKSGDAGGCNFTASLKRPSSSCSTMLDQWSPRIVTQW